MGGKEVKAVLIPIGDTMNDIIASRRAGYVTVGYKINGDYKIEGLNQILSIIKQKDLFIITNTIFL